MSLYFLTGNENKFAEVRAILGAVEQLDIDLPEIQEMDSRAIVRAKLVEAQKHQAGDFIVEDTALSFKGLNGLPGPFIKWFLDAIGNNGLAALAASSSSDRATARTVIGLAQGHEVHFF